MKMGDDVIGVLGQHVETRIGDIDAGHSAHREDDDEAERP